MKQSNCIIPITPQTCTDPAPCAKRPVCRQCIAGILDEVLDRREAAYRDLMAPVRRQVFGGSNTDLPRTA